MSAIPPRTRGECIDGPRPCPWRACRYHLAPASRDLPFDANGATCALDVAAGGPRTLEEIAPLLGVTRERVRQIEVKALTRFVRRARTLGHAEELGLVEVRR